MQSQIRRTNKEEEKMRILVAEDDSFQRLALIDILSLYSYDVTPVENGVHARDELLKDEAYFDLVLLDLMMPQIDGLEVLTLMKSVPSLKDIPVIMMSSDGEMEIVATCMDKGAADYLIKPIRIQNVKDLAKHINRNLKKKNQDNTLINYERISLLGRGAAGSVELVRRSTDNELFALKTIQMHFMTPEERKLAENEIALLKVLKGPTIVRYYDSFIENEAIHIVMEYAEGGAISDKITEFKNSGKEFTKTQIMLWMAQIILAILLMHSKNILHRDIKSQNMFLTKTGVIKLGDFGIAKALGTQVDFAKTFLGTPYFMSPEVCKGDSYGQKADIWAIGCVLYELCAFKRPFHHDQLAGVFEMIINKDPAPLPAHIDPELQQLTKLLLQKDPDRRPSIFGLLDMAMLKEYVDIVLKNEDSDQDFLELYNKKQENKENKTEKDKQQEEEPEVEGLFSELELIRKKITYKDVKVGWFSKAKKVFSGEQFYFVLSNLFNVHNVNKLCQQFLTENIIKPVFPSTKQFEQLSDVYYKFVCDEQNFRNYDVVLNQPSAKAHQMIERVFEKGLALFQAAKEEINKSGQLSEAGIKDYLEPFEQSICMLQRLKFKREAHQNLAFFLNLYQIMALHKVVYTSLYGQKKKLNLFQYYYGQLWDYFYSDDSFCYSINNNPISLNMIFHGILRGGKTWKDFKEVPEYWKNMVQKFDERVLTLFCYGNDMPYQITEFQQETLNEQLDQHAANFVYNHVFYDEIENEIFLHKIFQDFSNEFDQEAQIKFLIKYIKNVNKKMLIEAFKEETIIINIRGRD